MSIYLYVQDFDERAALPGCGSNSSCDQVINSRWATWAGMPIVLLGIAGYIGMVLIGLVIAFTHGRYHDVPLWAILTVISLTSIGFILWLLGLQWLHIGRFCIYCLTNHLLGLLAFGAVLRQAPDWCNNGRRKAFLSVSVPGLLAVMIGLHVWIEPQQIHAQTADDVPFAQTAESAPGGFTLGIKKQSRNVSLLEEKLNFDLYTVPLDGSPEAPHVVVELFDYACPSCRDLHEQLNTYRKEQNIDLAIVRLVVPIHPDCNPHAKRAFGGYFKYSCTYAKLALAVWLAKPSAYEEYHAWMMQPGKPPMPNKAREKAIELVGEAPLDATLKKPEVEQWIKQAADVLNFLGAENVPKLIAGDTLISYGSSNRKTFDRTLSEALKLEKGK
jgi:uncharacterized membrane protein/protein-disulfide isomerase